MTDERDWTLRGTVFLSDRTILPDFVFDMRDTSNFAVFTDDEAMLWVPQDEVEP